MALRYPEQRNFSRGVITPKLHARADLDQFRLALRDADNVLILRHGALTRRSGTQYVHQVKAADDNVRLIEFIFDNDQAYVIEMGTLGGAGYFRFYTNLGYVEDPGNPGNPYEVAHAFTGAQIMELSYSQSFDTIYFAHKDVAPKLLQRLSETSWTLSNYPFYDGPYNPLNVTATTLTPSGTATGASITVTASSTAGINGGAGFQAADVGRWVRILQSSTYGSALITAINSTTQVQATVGRAFLSTAASAAWRLGTWRIGNYPSVVGLYTDRVAWANAPTNPSTIWLSASGVFEDFGVSTTLGIATDVDPLTFDIVGVSKIEWLAELDDLLYGTPINARAIGPTDRGGGLTATSVSHRKGQRVGAKRIRPVVAGSAVLYSSVYGKAVREMTFSYDNDAYTQPEASILSEQLLRSGIEEMSVALEPEPTIWMRVGDGSLVSMVYDVEQKMIALMPHHVTKASADNGEFADVIGLACIPGGAHYEQWVIVKRTIDGATTRYIEVMRPPFSDDDAITESFFVDSGLEYIGAATDSLGGFDHLIGETVSVLVDGAYHPQVEVNEDGEIALEFEGEHIVAGLPLGAHVETMEIPQQEDGSLRGRKRKLYKVFIDVLNSGPVDIRQAALPDERVGKRNSDDDMDAAVPLFTGVHEAQPESSWDKEGRIIVSVDPTLPLPMMIRSITPAYEAEP